MSPRAINEIVHGKRSITANSALRLAKFFGNSAEFWIHLQTSYDLEKATKSIDLDKTKKFHAAQEVGAYNYYFNFNYHQINNY